MTKYAKKCSLDRCKNEHLAKGFCGKHYYRWKKYGDPEFVKLVMTETPEEAFALRTEWQGACLIWIGRTKTKEGYGLIHVNSRYQGAHRYAWEREHGPILEDMLIDHTCHNKACVNIRHLRLATASQNSSHLSGAQANNSSSGIRNVYWSYDKWQVSVTKNGKRYSFGIYDDLDEAAEMAKAARKKLFSEFAGN